MGEISDAVWGISVGGAGLAPSIPTKSESKEDQIPNLRNNDPSTPLHQLYSNLYRSIYFLRWFVLAQENNFRENCLPDQDSTKEDRVEGS
jgi:hypothetical protein